MHLRHVLAFTIFGITLFTIGFKAVTRLVLVSLSSLLRTARPTKAALLIIKSILLALLLTLTSGCGLYHFVFIPPTDCACTPEMMQALQASSAQGQEDESAIEDESLNPHPDDGVPLDDYDQAHAADHDHSHDDEEGDENEIVADIAPGDLKTLGVEETNEGTATSRLAAADSPEERQKQAARLERAHQIVDVVESSARIDLTEKAQRAATQTKYNVTLPSSPNAQAVVGDFFHEQDNLVIVTPGNSIKIYSNGRLAAQRPLVGQDDTMDLGEITKDPVLPIRLVQNSTLQLLVHAAETQPDGAILYNTRIYKVFGNEIGLIFDKTIARRDAKDQPLTQLGKLEFLNGMNHRFIRWTPLDASKRPAAEPLIYRWNRWEGAYRLPIPPPTAPRS